MEFWRKEESSMGENIHTMAVEILLKAPKPEFFSPFLYNSISRFSISRLVEFFFSIIGFLHLTKQNSLEFMVFVDLLA
jgi:hypothetical protein